MEARILTSSNSSASANPVASSPSATPSRLWRPAAQRNLRNQWSKLRSSTDRWASAASEGRSNATGLVNAYLTRRYMPQMDLGVLKEMPGIREKACWKLVQNQGLCCAKFLSSYKDMVDVVIHLVRASGSFRCFLKGSATSSIVQFCHNSDEIDDLGDGGGIAVFSSWSMQCFEKLATGLVEMFMLELNLKRLLVVELLSLSCQEASGVKAEVQRWSDEIYHGEFDDLRSCNLLSTENHLPLHPGANDCVSDNSLSRRLNLLPDREALQVYLTTWLSDVNIDIHRVGDIFAMVEEEMQVKLS